MITMFLEKFVKSAISKVRHILCSSHRGGKKNYLSVAYNKHNSEVEIIGIHQNPVTINVNTDKSKCAKQTSLCEGTSQIDQINDTCFDTKLSVNIDCETQQAAECVNRDCATQYAVESAENLWSECTFGYRIILRNGEISAFSSAYFPDWEPVRVNMAHFFPITRHTIKYHNIPVSCCRQ